MVGKREKERRGERHYVHPSSKVDAGKGVRE